MSESGKGDPEKMFVFASEFGMFFIRVRILVLKWNI